MSRDWRDAEDFSSLINIRKEEKKDLRLGSFHMIGKISIAVLVVVSILLLFLLLEDQSVKSGAKYSIVGSNSWQKGSPSGGFLVIAYLCLSAFVVLTWLFFIYNFFTLSFKLIVNKPSVILEKTDPQNEEIFNKLKLKYKDLPNVSSIIHCIKCGEKLTTNDDIIKNFTCSSCNYSHWSKILYSIIKTFLLISSMILVFHISKKEYIGTPIDLFIVMFLFYQLILSISTNIKNISVVLKKP